MSDRLTQEQLDAIEKRASAATPGPWRKGDVEVDTVFCEHGASIGIERVLLRANPHFPYEHDTEFIAHSRSDVPALIAEIRLLQRDLKDARKDCHYLTDRLARMSAAAEALCREHANGQSGINERVGLQRVLNEVPK